LSNFIQDLLRDKPPVMVLDMGLGSRLQGFPVHDSEPMRVIATTAPIDGEVVQSRSID
jgi:hypothetical protein